MVSLRTGVLNWHKARSVGAGRISMQAGLKPLGIGGLKD